MLAGTLKTLVNHSGILPGKKNKNTNAEGRKENEYFASYKYNCTLYKDIQKDKSQTLLFITFLSYLMMHVCVCLDICVIIC